MAEKPDTSRKPIRSGSLGVEASGIVDRVRADRNKPVAALVRGTVAAASHYANILSENVAQRDWIARIMRAT
jgi:hypothetical protein